MENDKLIKHVMSEQEKLSMLQALAKDKYQIELTKIDFYLPKDKKK